MLFVYIILATACFVVSLSDIRERTIKNSHVAVIAVLAMVIGSADYSLASIWILGICWSALLVLHIFNLMGGGDVKLIAAFSLALPTTFLLPALVLWRCLGECSPSSICSNSGGCHGATKSMTVRRSVSLTELQFAVVFIWHLF